MSARQRLAFFLLVCCVIPLAFLRPRSADRNIGPQPDGSVLVPTNQMATPLTDCFTSVPDRTPYRVRPNRIPLDEINPPERALRGEARHWATASRKLDLSDVDRADATIVARAVWHHCKPGTPFPWAHFRPNTDG